MRKKFGGYSINAKKMGTSRRQDGLLQTQTLLEGDIEIGIHIDPNTWRGDWLRDFTFGKDSWQSYRLMNVMNSYLPVDPNSGIAPEKNLVTAVWLELN